MNGWLAKSAENGQIPESVKLVLSATDGRHYLLKTRKTLRPDVGSYFKKKELGASGYEATADVSGLHGNYTLGLAYEENGIMKLCPMVPIFILLNYLVKVKYKVDISKYVNIQA